MTTDFRAAPDADDDFVELLTAHLDRLADGDIRRDGAEDVADQPLPAGFESLAGDLRLAATWAGPPPDLRDAILTRVRTLNAPPVVDAPVVTAPVVDAPAVTAPVETDPGPMKPRRTVPAGDRNGWDWPRVLAGLRNRWRRLAWAVPAVAVAAALFTGGVLAVDRALQPGQPQGSAYSAAGTDLAPGATAQVLVVDRGSGFVITLNLDGLPAAAPGSYYAAWLTGPGGVAPLGSFHQRSTGIPIQLWSGVDPGEYPNLIVTLQAESDPPTPSTSVVLQGSVGR